ncbi:MAG: hypothetical protein Q9164_007708 [Protoblastenia rupestris]
MGILRKLFTSKHKKLEPCGTPQSSARSTGRPGLRPPLTEQKSPDVFSPLPTTSNSATTVELACLAPLEDIGSYQKYQLRAAASTDSQKGCLPRGAETGRPSTSHAARSSPSIAHQKVEAFCVDSKPGSLYSKSSQPKRAASQVCAAKPSLDGDVHPAYRKERRNNENFHQCTTGKQTELSSLRKSAGEQRPHHQANDQRRAADTSILSTQGQKPDEPSPPRLPLRSMPSWPLRTTRVPLGSSSSARRDQQPGQHEDDDQRRAANTTNLGNEGQERHESPPPPPLPPRPQVALLKGI